MKQKQTKQHVYFGEAQTSNYSFTENPSPDKGELCKQPTAQKDCQITTMENVVLKPQPHTHLHSPKKVPLEEDTALT